MMSMENSMHRMLTSNEDTRRLLYLSSLHRPSVSGHRTQPDPSGHRAHISGTQQDLSSNRTLPDLSGQISSNRSQSGQISGIRSQPQLSGIRSQPQLSGTRTQPQLSGTQPQLSGTQPQLSGSTKTQSQVKRLEYQQTPVQTNAVSRRNARERKRVRLVNLGFSNLRERVPSGTKNKKLSKVETLRAAIEYIRQLQDVLGMPDQYGDLERMMESENFDCESVGSSEEVRGASGGSGDLSPVSSHPSESSLLNSPYQHAHDEQLMDIGLWFS